MKAQYIEAPDHEVFQFRDSLFLAGGISDCYDWQKDAVTALTHLSVVLVNPRRANFDISKPEEGVVQIKWESNYLSQCSQILFWFASETVCPITLFELGAALERRRNAMEYDGNLQQLFIGAHKMYPRLLDVQVQSKLYGHGVVTDFSKLMQMVVDYNTKGN